MSKLYSDLAEVYEAMYATFIDYEDEYNFYSEILNSYNKKSLLEIGSGTGNLSGYFKENGFEYQGLDFSKEMIELAKRKNPDCDFIEGDMRAFELEQAVQSIIITGRSISYIVSNQDVNSTITSVYENLEKGGIFCFDFIDANRFIPEILQNETVVHKATKNAIHYVREATWRLKMEYGMDLIWEASYKKEVGGEMIELGKDSAKVRTFTKNEIALFLEINGFEVKKIMDRENYTFPTYVVVAEKKV